MTFKIKDLPGHNKPFKTENLTFKFNDSIIFKLLVKMVLKYFQLYHNLFMLPSLGLDDL